MVAWTIVCAAFNYMAISTFLRNIIRNVYRVRTSVIVKKQFSPFAPMGVVGRPKSVKILVPIGACDGGCLWWGSLTNFVWWNNVQVIGCPLNWLASGRPGILALLVWVLCLRGLV